MTVIDNRTPNLDLRLPNPSNKLKDDILRLVLSLQLLDTAVAGRALSSHTHAIADVTGLVTALADKLSASAPATTTRLGGVKVGANLIVDPDGTLSAVYGSGGGGSTGLPVFSDIFIVPGSNGQTVFTVSGGYNPGQIDVYVNGHPLPPSGADYTATNGTSITLAEGIGTDDLLWVRRWIYLPADQALNKTGDTMTGALFLAADPVAGLQPATKQYVDALVAGLKGKASVKAATTANITLSGAQTIDNVSVVAGDRVLVKNQSPASQNGIYVAAAGSWVRTTDADAWAELVAAYVMVEQGTVNADTGWLCTVDQGGTIGTTAVAWVKFSGGFVQPGNANTFTAQQSLAGSATEFGLLLKNAKEVTQIIGTAPAATQNIDIASGASVLFTANATANWVINLRFNSGASLDSVMSVGETVTAVVEVPQGTTPYFMTALQIDGAAVTPRWQGSLGSPTAGNASSLDAYSITVTKTAAATFTVRAALTQWKA